jgi:hypothetical protein
MVSVAEITDTALHEALTCAEDALDEGDYVGSVRHSVDAYSRLIAQRPDMIVAPRFGHSFAAPQLGASTGGAIGGQSMAAPRPWPSDHGVRFSLDEASGPTMTFAKDHFTLSEAATYFEYTLDMALRAQRRPPP